MQPAISHILMVLTLLVLIATNVSAQDSIDKDYADQLPRIPATDALESIGRFELVDKDLKIELIASEPMVMDPVAITFDEWGRAFVVEMRGYSERQDQKLGRIKLLEDADGDGRLDSATIFADGFRWPTGVVCFQGGILVADAPDIVFLKDRDGDSKSDTRQIVFTGFGTSNVQQLPNSLQWGIDNRIYGASGGNGGRLKRAEISDVFEFRSVQFGEQAPFDLRGRDFVLNPRTVHAYPISGGTQFGMTFDRWGNRFVCSNSDHCQQIIFEDRYARQNPFHAIQRTRTNIATDGSAAEVFRVSSTEPWRTVRTRLRVQGLVRGPIEGGGRAAGYFTSASGLTCYDGDGLPEKYRGNLFVGDVGSNLVHRKRLEVDGIAMRAVRTEQGTEFLRSPDNWFRPVQMANSPDGSLILLDMYREVIEHPASLPPLIKKHLDLNSGNSRGRLYRIVPAGHVSDRRLMPGDANVEQLVQMLEHPNGWHRKTAARLIHERLGILDDHTILIRELKINGLLSENPESRIRAMYLLAGLDQLDADEHVRLLADQNPNVRVNAVKLTESEVNPDPVKKQLDKMVFDRDLRVQFQVCLTKGQSNEDQSSSLATLAASSGDDPWMQIALSSSAHGNRGQLIQRLVRSLRKFPGVAPKYRVLLINLVQQLCRDPSDRDVTALRMALGEWPDEEPVLLGELLAILTSHMPADAMKKLNANEEGNGLSLDDRVRKSYLAALEQATNRKLTVGQRLEAINVLRLAKQSDVPELISTLIEFDQPPAIRNAAIGLAGYFGNLELHSILLDHYPRLNPELRRTTLRVILKFESWTRALLNQIEMGKINPRSIDAVARQQLVGHRNAELKRVAVALFDENNNSNRIELANAYIDSFDQLQGDIERGRELFRKSCSACHRLEDHGQEIGPNLAAFANRGVAAMITNIIDPNREVDPRYLRYLIRTEDGQTFDGMIETETATTVTLQNSEGNPVTILRNEIEEMKSTSLSLMPENFGGEINHAAMADLIEYLLSQGS